MEQTQSTSAAFGATNLRVLAGAGVLGALLGLALVSLQAQAVGGWAGLLQVGVDSSLRPFVEERLGPVPLAPEAGHDGQISFAIGEDLRGAEVPDLLDHAGYRYRRILYPATASVFGVVQSEGLLTGLIVVAVASFALSTMSTAWIGRLRGFPRWVLVGMLLNVGAWLGMWMLTPDALGLALSLLAIASFLRGQRWLPALLLAGAALAKDQYLLVAASLAILAWREDRLRSLSLVTLPGAVLAAWSLWVSSAVGSGFTPRRNLGLPFEGIATALGNWDLATSSDVTLGSVALVLVIAAPAAALWSRDRTWLTLTLPWSILAISASDWVWNVGNNAIRAFAILGPLLVLSLAEARKRSPLQNRKLIGP